jgi:hypothetical protein
MAYHKKPVLPKNLASGRYVRVSKLDAVRQQLDSAAYLKFHVNDSISILSLAYAAIGILDPLLKAKGLRKQSLLRSDIVKPEYQAQAEEFFREAGNFFKHGAKDAFASLDFAPEDGDLFLFLGIWGYGQITEELTAKMSAASIWLRVWSPQFFPHAPADARVDQLRRHYQSDCGPIFYSHFMSTGNAALGKTFPVITKK